jgi:hypothetical protein
MMVEKEREFDGVRKILQELQQLKAPEYFEADLMRKINAGEFPDEKKENWFSRILVPKRVIPSAALAVAAVLILFVIKPGSGSIENPFNVQPRVRKDIVSSSQLSVEKKVDKALREMIKKENHSVAQKSKTNVNDQQKQRDDVQGFQPETRSSEASENFELTSTPGSDSYQINKNGLNFRQVNLTRSERMQINRMKENLMRFMNENSQK